MKRSILLAVMVSGLALSASAQEPQTPQTAQQQAAATPENAVENVIVTEPRLRSERALNNFVITHAAATPLLGKIARWKTGICPITIGLPPKLALYINQRILRVAMAAGAPLATSEPCHPNIAVLATPEPQKVLDFVRAKRPALLGFHYRPQAERIATMKLAVQAWYSTATEDFNGMISGDLPNGDLGYGVMSARGEVGSYASSGSRLGDGLKSEFTAAIILVDINKIGGQEIGPLSDYIAMLAISQGQSYDACQSVPTITNLMAPNCDADMKPAAITDVDMTFLRGLYRMRADGSYLAERGSIAYEMKKDLGGY
ncbi:MAG TPA: hypothetical protein VNX61_13375 [Rhizomicrobium sp.]|nr:hypothetical protein [Rhizomicrobium sp.]